jgi:signal transduction histidine kinase
VAHSLLNWFLSAQDRVLYRQHAALIVSCFPLLITSNFLLYIVFTLMFTAAIPWFWHTGFGLFLLLLSIAAALLVEPINKKMQRSPEVCVSWVLAMGLPITIWWSVYFTVLLQYTNNATFLQQFAMVLCTFVFIAIATVGRFSRTIIFFLTATIIYVIPLLLYSELEGSKIVAIELLLSALAALFFLRTLNEQIAQLFRVEDKNNELLDALQQKNIALEQANVSQSRYLSAASHDLRQPLHALALLTNDVQRKNSVPEIGNTLKKMELAIDSLSQSFNAMLNLSRLDAGVVKPQFKRFPIQRLLQRLAIEYADIAEEKGLSLTIRPSKVWTLSDEDMLYSILSNFLSNALRYTQKGGVLIGTRDSGKDHFKIVVYDTGSGVPSEKAQQIFQEYSRLEEAEQRVKGGVGLGLAISERMARLLGAKLWVKSAVGQGSVFGLILTQTQPTEEQIEQAEPLHDILANQRVAIFDDDEIALESLSDLLSSWGMDVSIVLSSAMYAELIQEEGPFDFVISDYHLGLMNETGLDILRNARYLTPENPPACLLLTGDTRTDLAHEAQAAGVHLWYKPIRPVRLRAYLNGLAQPIHTQP